MNITYAMLTALTAWVGTQPHSNSMESQEHVAEACGVSLPTPLSHMTRVAYAQNSKAITECYLRYPTFLTAAAFSSAARGGKVETALILMPVNVDNASTMSDVAIINAGLVALVRCPLDLLYTPLPLSLLNCNQ
jgi:hypothetical protein